MVQRVRARWAVGGLLATLLASSPASAQDCAAPLDVGTFQQVVDQAHEALLYGNLARHGEIVADLRQRTPCLSAPVPVREWAKLLYELAMVRSAAGEPWKDLVATALHVDPALDRSYGPVDVRTYVPPEVTAQPVVRPDPGDAELWLDGRPAPATFDLTGVHVLQSRRAGVWTSWWVDDGKLPTGWGKPIAAPEPVPALDPVPAPDPVPVPVPEPTRRPSPNPPLALRVHVGLGVAAAFGPPFETADVTEAAARVWIPAELGLGLDVRAGWLRATGEVLGSVNGPQVYAVDGRTVTARVAAGGALAGGGRIGPGHVGALVGARVPSRIVAQAVGGYTTSSGVGFEARAGVNVTTASSVEPSFAVLFVYSPRVWSAGK